jgi:geranylgeranyl diphosphate synthase type I
LPIPKNPFLALVPAVKADVDARLHGYLDARIDEARLHGDEVVQMVQAISDLCLRGGKRLRPALVAVGYRAVSADAELDVALDAGVAVELLQAYFLIHDDWMDRDSIRRGGPTVHELLTKRFASQRVGHASAVLAGDYAVALASDSLARLDLPDGRAAAIFGCFAQMQMDAVAGQQIDLVARARDVEAAYALKTGSYTVKGPLRLGALLAGGSPRLLSALDRFALPAGIAFQLRDDLLSAFGDPRDTGKPFGNDLKTAKRTVLLVTAESRATRRDRRVLERAVGNAKATTSELRDAIEVLERSGARQEVERRIDELVDGALAALRSGRITAEGRALLEGAAQALTARFS